MGYLGYKMSLYPIFAFTLAIASGGWLWQYLRLRDPNLPRSAYGEIFGQNVWLGFILLAGMLVSLSINH